MEKQRTYVADLAAKSFRPQRLTGTEKDFILLQRILDAKVLKSDQTWELQSLGVVFGDALVKWLAGLHWMQVTDEYGTDPALLYKDTTLQLNPVTMLQKRVEDGKTIDVLDLVAALEDHVQENAGTADNRREYEEP